MQRATVLVVDDEKDLLDTLQYNLERDGHRAIVATSGAEALRLSAEEHVDLVVLDLMLPDMSGVEVCRTLRQNERLRRIPVIMLTARSGELDRVVGFEVGADDYVVKPFSVRELTLRVRAVLRRSHHPPAARDEARVDFGRLAVDRTAHQAWVGGVEVHLTPLEFKLLNTLLERRGRVQTRNMLLTDVWEMSDAMTTRTVDTHVKRLRKKLGAAGGYIETLRGVGYRFRSDAEAGDTEDGDGEDDAEL